MSSTVESPSLKLECHFEWQLEKDSKKSLQDVITNTRKILEVDPLNKVGYYTLLSYVYSQSDTVNFKEAENCLKSADEVCQRVRSSNRDQLSSDYLTCEFVIDANRLSIRNINQGEQLKATLQDLQDRWKILDDESRASVFAVKGLALMTFGPKKYPDAVDAYAEANRLSQRRKFLFLFGEADLRARQRRLSSNQTPAEVDEVSLWQEAYDRSADASADFDRANFMAVFAEAVLNNRELQELCISLISQAWGSVKDCDLDTKVRRKKIILKCTKCSSILKKNCDSLGKAVGNLNGLLTETLSCLFSIMDRACNPDIYLRCSIELRNEGELDKSRCLLETAQMIADKPGHLYVDLKLIVLKDLTHEERNEPYTKDDCLTDYDNLITKYKTNCSDVSLIQLYKAAHQVRCGDINDALLTMRKSDKNDAKVWQRMEVQRLRSMYRRIQESQLDTLDAGHLAWFLQRVKTHPDKLADDVTERDLRNLYEKSLAKDSQNEFSLEHLGRLHLSCDRQCDAEYCFQRLLSLSPSTENRKLLSTVLLLAYSNLTGASNTLQKLDEGLKCGCKDAGLRILEILAVQKSISPERTGQRVMSRTLGLPDAMQQTQHPVFFERAVYEYCARICNLLRDESSFFVDQHWTKEPGIFMEGVMEKVEVLLGLSELTSKDDQSAAGRVLPDRGSLMRSDRLELTRLHLLNSEHGSEKANLIVKVLKESKEVLDRSVNLVLLTCKGRERVYYPHAFDQIRRDGFKKRFNQAASDTRRRKLEMESLMKLLKEKPELKELETVRKNLQQSEMMKIDSNFHQRRDTKDLFSFMLKREHRILSSEDCWIIRWIYLVNCEKHEDEILVNDLNEQLRSDYSRDGQCSTAYDVAHLAAEFAEETWAVFSGFKATRDRDNGGGAQVLKECTSDPTD